MDKGLKIIGPLTNIYAQTESRNLRVISGTQAKRAGYDRDGGLIDQWLNLPETNPRALKLPSKFTPAEVRVNEQGKVQIRINPAKLGSGGRFAKCVESVTARGGAIDPRAVCAAAGRKKYGAKKLAAMGRAGRNPLTGWAKKARRWTVWEKKRYVGDVTAAGSKEALRAAKTRWPYTPGIRVRLDRSSRYD
jgi:hypothetical protein